MPFCRGFLVTEFWETPRQKGITDILTAKYHISHKNYMAIKDFLNTYSNMLTTKQFTETFFKAFKKTRFHQ